MFISFQAASSLGTGIILSSWATSTIEEVAEACTPEGLRWFQLYVYRDRNVVRDLVRRAEQAGYKALFVTVDTPMLGRRLADVRNKFSLPSHLRYEAKGCRKGEARHILLKMIV